MKRWSATLFMVALAAISIVIHFITGWHAYVEDQASHSETALWGSYLNEWLRQTFENWQSEFVQLAVQMALLAGLLERFRITAYEQDNEQIKERLG